jgi:nuclear GTP-binding protein
MYNTRAKRDKSGKILHEVRIWSPAALSDVFFRLLNSFLALQDLQSKELPTTRIQPDRRWFGNTRVIGQKQLEQFREEMSTKVNDAYTVLLREKKLPLQLLEDPERKVGGKQARVNLLSTQSFSDTFGPNRRRKRPRLMAEGYEQLVQSAADKVDK